LVKEYGPDEGGKQLARLVFVILLGFGLLIGAGYLMEKAGIGNEDSGPCSQYKTDAAKEFCFDGLDG
jgi:hypothetical protein